jgi:hypothetical protein
MKVPLPLPYTRSREYVNTFKNSIPSRPYVNMTVIAIMKQTTPVTVQAVQVWKALDL